MMTNINQIFPIIKNNILKFIMAIIFGYVIGFIILNLKFYNYKEPRPSFNHNIILKKNSLYTDISSNYPLIAKEIDNFLNLFTVNSNTNVLLDAKLPDRIKNNFNTISIRQKPDHVVIEINSDTDKVNFTEFFADFFNENIRNGISKDRILDSLNTLILSLSTENQDLKGLNNLEPRPSFNHNIILKKNSLYTDISSNYPLIAKEIDNFLNLFTLNDVNDNINILLDAKLPDRIKNNFNTISIRQKPEHYINQKPDYFIIEINSDTDKVNFTEFFADFFNENISNIISKDRILDPLFLEHSNSFFDYKNAILDDQVLNQQRDKLKKKYPKKAEELVSSYKQLFIEGDLGTALAYNRSIILKKNPSFLDMRIHFPTPFFNEVENIMNLYNINVGDFNAFLENELPDYINKDLINIYISNQSDFIKISLLSNNPDINYGSFFSDFYNKSINKLFKLERLKTTAFYNDLAKQTFFDQIINSLQNESFVSVLHYNDDVEHFIYEVKTPGEDYGKNDTDKTKILYKSIKDRNENSHSNLISQYFKQKDFLNKLEEGKYLDIYLSDVRLQRVNFPMKPPELELILPLIYSILSFLGLLLILINVRSLDKITTKE